MRSEADSPIMLLAVHSFRFSCIFYPRAQSRGLWCEREQTEVECRDGGLDGREKKVEVGYGVVKRITSFHFRL